MSNIIQELEAEQMGKTLPDFGPGDTVVVQVKVVEGQRERLQAFEGVVIAKRNRGLLSGRHGIAVFEPVDVGDGCDTFDDIAVYQHQSHVCFLKFNFVLLDGLQRFDDAELLDRLVHARPAPHTRRVDEGVVDAVPGKVG